MSKKDEHLGRDGAVVGVTIHYAERRPTKRSSGAHLTPNGSEGRHRLTVRCGQVRLLGVFGGEPATLLGAFTADHLLLRGAEVVTHRPDLELAGQRPADRPVVADTASPLELWCPKHRSGHDLDPALLRAELSKADAAGTKDPSCAVERVAVTPSNPGVTFETELNI